MERTSNPGRGSLAVLLTTLGAIALTAGGCVSKKEYEKLQFANSKANERIQRLEKELASLEGQSGDFANSQAAAAAALAEKEKALKLFEARTAAQDKKFQELLKLYEALQKKVGEGAVVVLPPELNEALKEFALKNPSLMDFDASRGLVRLKSDLLFGKGSDLVKPEVVQILQKLAEILVSPTAGEFNVLVVGHTDDLRIARPATRAAHPTNWHLSAHRAIAVMRVLASAGVASERIGVLGFGEYRPIAPNAPGKKGNPKNRRVEVFIVPAGQINPTG